MIRPYPRRLRCAVAVLPSQPWWIHQLLRLLRILHN